MFGACRRLATAYERWLWKCGRASMSQTEKMGRATCAEMEPLDSMPKATPA